MEKELIYQGLRSYCFAHKMSLETLGANKQEYDNVHNLCVSAAKEALNTKDIEDIKRGKVRVVCDGHDIMVGEILRPEDEVREYKRYLFKDGSESYEKALGNRLLQRNSVNPKKLTNLFINLPATRKGVKESMGVNIGFLIYDGQEEALLSLLTAVSDVVNDEALYTSTSECTLAYNSSGYFEAVKPMASGISTDPLN